MPFCCSVYNVMHADTPFQTNYVNTCTHICLVSPSPFVFENSSSEEEIRVPNVTRLKEKH